jgi:hypothetical protein
MNWKFKYIVVPERATDYAWCNQFTDLQEAQKTALEICQAQYCNVIIAQVISAYVSTIDYLEFDDIQVPKPVTANGSISLTRKS